MLPVERATLFFRDIIGLSIKVKKQRPCPSRPMVADHPVIFAGYALRGSGYTGRHGPKQPFFLLQGLFHC